MFFTSVCETEKSRREGFYGLPNGVDLQFMTIYDVYLFEYVVYVPNFHSAINGRSNDAIPVTYSQRFQLYNAPKMCVQNFDEFLGLHAPNIQIFPVAQLWFMNLRFAFDIWLPDSGYGVIFVGA